MDGFYIFCSILKARLSQELDTLALSYTTSSQVLFDGSKSAQTLGAHSSKGGDAPLLHLPAPPSFPSGIWGTKVITHGPQEFLQVLSSQRWICCFKFVFLGSWNWFSSTSAGFTVGFPFGSSFSHCPLQRVRKEHVQPNVLSTHFASRADSTWNGPKVASESQGSDFHQHPVGWLQVPPETRLLRSTEWGAALNSPTGAARI